MSKINYTSEPKHTIKFEGTENGEIWITLTDNQVSITRRGIGYFYFNAADLDTYIEALQLLRERSR